MQIIVLLISNSIFCLVVSRSSYPRKASGDHLRYRSLSTFHMELAFNSFRWPTGLTVRSFREPKERPGFLKSAAHGRPKRLRFNHESNPPR